MFSLCRFIGGLALTGGGLVEVAEVLIVVSFPYLVHEFQAPIQVVS